jgi:hypothetical protein
MIRSVPRFPDLVRQKGMPGRGWRDGKIGRRGNGKKKSWVNGDRKQGIIGIWIASLVAGKSRMMGTGNYHIFNI